MSAASVTPGPGVFRSLSTEDAEPMSRREISDALVGKGFDREQAQAAMGQYLRDTSARVGFPVYQWALDSYDLDCIVADYAPNGVDAVERARDAVAGLPDAAEVEADGDELAPVVEPYPDIDEYGDGAADGAGS